MLPPPQKKKIFVSIDVTFVDNHSYSSRGDLDVSIKKEREFLQYATTMFH